MSVRIPPPQYFDDVANRGAVERRHDANLARQRRQGAFPRRVEQAFLLQTLFQLFECELQRTESLRFEMLADKLIFALRFIDRNLAARDDARAVGRFEFEVPQRGLEHEAAQLRAIVLQREVQMTGVPHAAVGQFTFDPHLEQLGFEQSADLDRQVSDGENATDGRRCCRLGLRLSVFFKKWIEQIRHYLLARCPTPLAHHSPPRTRAGDPAAALMRSRSRAPRALRSGVSKTERPRS